MYDQSTRKKALEMLALTGDFEKSAGMSGISGGTLRRWAADAAAPQRRTCRAKFKPTATRSGQGDGDGAKRRILQGRRGSARHRKPRCCTLLAERRRNEGGADGRPGKNT